MSLKLYLVSFDFRSGGDYASLREHMRTLQAQQVLDRQWALRSKETAVKLKERLRGFSDPEDGISEMTFTGNKRENGKSEDRESVPTPTGLPNGKRRGRRAGDSAHGDD